MVEPFKFSPVSILFVTSSYTVPAERFALAYPNLINGQAFSVLNPSPNNCTINSSIVLRRSFTTNLTSGGTFTIPAGSWNVYYSSPNARDTNNGFDIELVSSREAIDSGRFLPLEGGATTVNNLSFERRISARQSNQKPEFTFVKAGDILSGSGSFQWIVALFRDHT